ncbi:prolyl oligopeptidase family serine peptidase [Pseudoalteromonas sp. JBTF-M23]|uniref:Prolyl oligopeptidase family serine peptidase n=1 Tax=Pseudoalteromonas caenipelagi TaxID=2726988 RepID=A0A849VHD9_9GAMM|nr:DPP IV N-terminal domain-containing protein [Pseudoalteromonas caenipelagi]NOU52822.1 prolyl oligopeptidase family serine peptidase [Pseudoalteromonas caenipelagi]
MTITPPPHLVLLSVFFLLTACQSIPPSKPSSPHVDKYVTQSDYRRAEQFLPHNLKTLVKNAWLEAHWLDGKNMFWFRQQVGEDGQQFILVDAQNNTQKYAFDHAKLMMALEKVGLKSSSPFHLPLNNPNITSNDIRFQSDEKAWRCDLVNYRCHNEPSKPDKTTGAGTSPNGQWQLLVKDYNLVLRSTASGIEKQLTNDGSEKRPYALTHSNPSASFYDHSPYPDNGTDIMWSANSRFAITHKLDRSNTGKLTLVQADTGNGLRPRAISYYYPMAGDKQLPMADIILIDTQTSQATKLDTPAVMQTYYGGPIWGWWQDNDRFVYHDRKRGNQHYAMREINPETKTVRTLVNEQDDKFIDPWTQIYWHLPKRNEFVWSSQRSGYQHLYLYDGKTGELKNAITQGEMTVRVIRGIDEKKGYVYFEASGREPNRDPYYRHLYRVNLDGTGLKLLTPEPAEHSTQLSEDFQYVIDTYSTTTSAPITVLRHTQTGKVIKLLQRADITGLLATGWQPPKPFRVLAGDNKTPLYGLMYLPSNFDPNKKYPIIDDIYTGPHNFFTPKSFNTYGSQANALAELGFIVIKMDGRGTSKRGRAFHEYSFKNLGGGVDDHVVAIKRLAQQFAFIDLDKVGIYGFSAGGYDTAHAMFKYPEFFKVGVAASGNHDFRADKAGWNEMWMGYPVTKHWDEQSNLTIAKQLRGKLLLAHGELDPNVHPAATLQLVAKLMQANKDFDLMIYPNMGHVLDKNPYFVRKRWDYFVEHLLDAQPPKDYHLNW